MTANGTEISDGESLSGSQVVRVYGDNLTPPYFSLWFNGVQYTPLDYGDGYVEYLLQDNGTYEIRNERDVVMEFGISDAIVPAMLPTTMVMELSDNEVWYQGNHKNHLSVTANCIQYPYKAEDNYPYFYLYVQKNGQSAVLADFAVINGTFTSKGVGGSGNFGMAIEPISPNESVFVTFQGFIIAAFNYTTTP